MPSEQRRLAKVSELLGAERNPYYVRNVPPTLRRAFPSEGWYWVPPGNSDSIFLARDAFDAYHELMSRLETQETPA